MSKAISKTALDEIIKEIKFDPRKPGPYKVISDMSDPEYFRKRAIEELSQSSNVIEGCQKAIRLLLLAIFYYRSTGFTIKSNITPSFPINPNTGRS